MAEFDRKKFFSSIKRVVIKVGSSVLTDDDGNLLENRFDEIAAQLNDLRQSNIEVILVSSGAIASGMKKLGMDE